MLRCDEDDEDDEDDEVGKSGRILSRILEQKMEISYIIFITSSIFYHHNEEIRRLLQRYLHFCELVIHGLQVPRSILALLGGSENGDPKNIIQNVPCQI